ncbi:MAG TPA: apolipoprotein N-acyltransferase [Allosphingosinicella sp.]|uniref:apolipoprotein N-acyltransferase n=1 Tax=Allosphingosinicella sp. TaxID=2823234 RepID=UPI002EDAF427
MPAAPAHEIPQPWTLPRLKPFLFAFLAGLLSALGFEPLNLWPLTLAGFGWLMWLLQHAWRKRRALALGWWFGVGQFVLGLNWIATAFTYQSAMPAWLGWVSVVLLSLYLAVYPAMAAGLAWRYGKTDRLAFVFLFAAAWIVTEWLRATMFTGFAWNPVGVSLLPTAAARLASIIGTYGLSGITVLMAGALVLIYERYRKTGFILLAVVVGLALVRFGFDRPSSGPAGAPLTIVQPNVGQELKWTDGFEDVNFARLRQLSATDKPGPRLLLWPEAAITEPLQDERRLLPLYPLRAAGVQQRLASVLRPGDTLLTGGVTFQSSDGRYVTSGTNSVFAMDTSGRIFGRYDKAHLVPYGEYLPARPILSAIGLSRLSPGDVDFDEGPGPRSLTLPGVGKVGLQICYEIIFSGHVVDRKNRPNFIFNPSNDAWFGRWGPPQHLAQARLRAIEEGLPVVRSTPTGISAVVDADGTLLQSIPWRQMGKIDALLPPAKAPTFFARFGNIVPFLLSLILVGIAIAVHRRAR